MKQPHSFQPRRRRSSPPFAVPQVELLEGRITPITSPFVLANLAGSTGTSGFVLNGAAADDNSGWELSAAGDVNGDGLADLLIGAPGMNSGAGAAYVMFGRPTGSPGSIDLAAIAQGVGGFVIHGAASGDRAGSAVAGAGDVNGDGLDDLLLGAPGAGGAGLSAGAAYVVFGKNSNTDPITLAALGSLGFILRGAAEQDGAGTSVAGAGDVNGDGLGDVIIGAPGSDAYDTDAGSAYVIFGKASTTAIDLANVAGVGFQIVGFSAGDRAGRVVAGAGDVNGDGRDDILLSSYWNEQGAAAANSAYIVFGKATDTEVPLGDLTTDSEGFAIRSTAALDQAGLDVAGAGDVNGDGLADLILGAHRADPGGILDAGMSVVVFGKRNDTQPIPLDAVLAGAGGFVIQGTAAGALAGFSVAGAGDVNNDGFGDLLIGAPGMSTAYVVFGKTSSLAVNLGALGTAGFVIEGERASDQVGFAVAAAGDLNRDGFADLLIGAPQASPAGRAGAGASYVIFGGRLDLAASPASPVATMPPLRAQVRLLRRHWQLIVLDAASGQRRFVVLFPGSPRGRRPVVTINSDTNDVRVRQAVGDRTITKLFDGETGTLLEVHITRRRRGT